MAELGSGPGSVFIDRKKRIRSSVHAEDEKKLKGMLKAYAKRRKNTKKAMPEKPSDLNWYQSIDSVLESQFETHYPDELKNAKSEYIDYCSNSDNYKYGKLEELNRLEEKEKALLEKSASIEKKELEVEALKKSIEEREAKLEKEIKEADEAMERERKQTKIQKQKIEVEEKILNERKATKKELENLKVIEWAFVRLLTKRVLVRKIVTASHKLCKLLGPALMASSNSESKKWGVFLMKFAKGKTKA